MRLEPRVVNAGKSGEFDAGVDVELAEDMAQVAVDGVMRNEEALSDLTIAQPVRDQPRDRELRVSRSRPASSRSSTHGHALATRRIGLAQGMSFARGALFHPQTQGKIERWRQTLKNRVLLENYFLPGDLGRQDRGVHRALQPPAHAPLARAWLITAE